MKCDTCNGEGFVSVSFGQQIIRRSQQWKQPLLHSLEPCPDCHNGEVSCCEGSPRDLAKGAYDKKGEDK
jgi:hypothetical protein